MKGVDLPIQVTNALHKSLGDEEKLLAEVQRDKDRWQQRKDLEDQVHDYDWPRPPCHVCMSLRDLWQSVCVASFAGSMIKTWISSDCYNMPEKYIFDKAPIYVSGSAFTVLQVLQCAQAIQKLLCAGNIDGTQSGLAGG